MIRTHVLTGAGSGIGAALAQRLVARGDRVLALARSDERAAVLSAAVPALAGVVVADLARPDTLAAAARETAAMLPGRRLDSLLHVAGVVELGHVAELGLAAWQAQLDVNLTAPYLLTAGLLPALRAGRGTVVLVNSSAGLSANPAWSGYAASKFGLRALADALRGEEPTIRVSTVYPGRTAGPMQEKVHAQEGAAYDASAWIRPGTVADAVLQLIDLPADATVTDLTVKPAPRG